MKQRQPIIAVIGESDASKENYNLAYEVGKLIAQKKWILINGGLTGVMEGASKGAHEAGGLVIGILPTSESSTANKFVSIPIVTNMGHARNVIIAQSADALIAIGGREGTLSEIAIGCKLGKPVVGINSWNISKLKPVATPSEAISLIEKNIDF